MQPCRRPRKAAFLGDANHVTELVKLHYPFIASAYNYKRKPILYL
jgi:hypothetical protein